MAASSGRCAKMYSGTIDNLLAVMLARTGTRKTEYTFQEIEETIYDNSCHAECRYNSDLLMIGDLISVARSDTTCHPDNLSRFRCLTDWRVKLADAAMLAITACTLFISPLTFIFDGSWSSPEYVPGGRTLMVFDFVLDLAYLAYLVLQLFVSILDPKRRVEIIDIKEIRRRRLTFIYVFEAVSATNYIWIMSANAPLIFNCVKLFRGRRFNQLPDSMWRWNGTRQYRLFKPAFFILFGSHWLACILGGYSGYAKLLKDCGVSCYETTIFGRPVSGKISLYFMAFVEALYMLTGSMDNPLGDGGARSGNFGNLIIVSVFGPIGCIVIAQFIAAVVREQQLMYSLEIRQEENIAFIKRGMENLDIPDELRTRVFSLLYFQKMGHDQEAFNKLFNKTKRNLSTSLESALRVVLYKDTVLCSRYFSNKDPNYILEVVRVLVDEMYLPGDFIIRRGEVGTQMFFVAHGKMSVLSVTKDEDGTRPLVINTIKNKGDFFGEIALVKDCVRTASVRADVYVQVSTLARQKIAMIWKYYPEEQEQLEKMVLQAAHRTKAANSASTQDVDERSATMLSYKDDVEAILERPHKAGFSTETLHTQGPQKDEDSTHTQKEASESTAETIQLAQDGATDTQSRNLEPEAALENDGIVASLDCDELRMSLRILGEQVDELLRRQNAIQSKLMLDTPSLQDSSLLQSKKKKKIVKKGATKSHFDESSPGGQRRVLALKRPKPLQIPKKGSDSGHANPVESEHSTPNVFQSSAEELTF